MLSVDRLTKRYGDTTILDELTFDVADGEILSIVGPSGAGKTTLLRCLSGLTPPSAGTVALDGQVVTEPPERLAVVFQDYSRSLMPWMRVETNVGLPIEHRVAAHERRERVRHALESVGLAHAAKLHPWQLSGGMQQRVAIARGLAYDPSVLLMDEPFASVDAQTRADLEDLVLRIRDEFGITVIVVTHDVDESVYLADRVLVLSSRPARISRIVDVDLSSPRDQISTKAEPAFADLRSEVLHLIKQAQDAAGGVTAASSAARGS